MSLLGRIMGAATPPATPPIDEAAYRAAFPYYAELCAISELRKKPGFGAELASGIGGHCLLYLNGVRLNRAAGYPELELCPPDANPGASGAGISVNCHYKNANWVAFENADFLWHGALRPGEALTPAGYRRTQEAALADAALAGVQFHGDFFRDKPPGMSELEFMYEISVATDYAVCFGRDTYRARLPLDAPRMRAIVDYLNALNTPYREGRRIYRWRLFNDNCVHVVRNALAAAGVWPAWPVGQHVARAMFKFPVPKNGFVDLMRHANDLTWDNPGALAITTQAIRDNAIYDTKDLNLIFFDHPLFGGYHRAFKRIFAEPRYFDLDANLRHFDRLYAELLAGAARLNPREASHISAQAASVRRIIAARRQVAKPLAEALT